MRMGQTQGQGIDAEARVGQQEFLQPEVERIHPPLVVMESEVLHPKRT